MEIFRCRCWLFPGAVTTAVKVAVILWSVRETLIAALPESKGLACSISPVSQSQVCKRVSSEYEDAALQMDGRREFLTWAAPSPTALHNGFERVMKNLNTAAFGPAFQHLTPRFFRSEHSTGHDYKCENMARSSDRGRLRRKNHVKSQSLSALVDMGSTPMWYPPASYQEESFIRQHHEPDQAHDHVFNTSYVHHEQRKQNSRAVESPTYPEDRIANPPPPDHIAIAFTPINKRTGAPRIMPTDSGTFAVRHDRRIPGFSIDMYDLQESQLQAVDRNDGRVYHFGHKGGDTYSGTFQGDQTLAPEIQAMIDKMLNKRNIAIRNSAGAASEQQVRMLLSTGSSLILERTPEHVDEDTNPHCQLPGCLSRADCIPPASYYLAFRHPEAFDQHAAKDFCFCLACMEWLWKGDFPREPRHPGIVPGMETIEPSNLLLDTAQTSPTTTPNLAEEGSHLHFDGTGSPIHDDCESRTPRNDSMVESPFCSERVTELGGTPKPSGYALRSPEKQESTPGYTHIEPEDLDDQYDSPRSQDSHGNWFYPPTRLQHIAAFIDPGLSLTEKTSAAVWLWKAASKEQLRWDRQMKHTEMRRKYYSGLSDDEKLKEPGFKMEDRDYEEEDIKYWEALTGVRMKQCHGNDLSEILYKTSKNSVP